LTGTVSHLYDVLCSNSRADGHAETDEELPMIRRVPSKPSRPVANSGDGIYVTVKWTEPEDNGGAEVTGYVIKYDGRHLFSESDSDNDTDSGELSVERNTTNFQFTYQLDVYTSYKFAVAAVNAVGQGEFSDFTDHASTWMGEYCCKSHVSYCELM